jgi:hypothetical protein
MKIKYYGLVSILLLTILMVHCANNDEKDFKCAASKLKSMLLDLDQVKSVTEQISSKEITKHTFIIDHSSKNDFITMHNKEFVQLANQFDTFIKNYPQSRWSDDAALCSSMLYLAMSIPGNGHYIEAVKSIKYYLSKFPDAHIEDWTKDNFKNIYPYVFDKNLLKPEDPLTKLSDDKRIQDILKRAIVFEYLKADKIFEAEKELTNYKKAGDKDTIFGLEDYLNELKEAKK